MIRYLDSAHRVRPADLVGFFEGWPDPPSPETHLEILRRSDEVVLAVEEHTGIVVGFITAITDRVLSAYIPLLEVRQSHRGHGVGSELVRRMLERLDDLYMVDLVCDRELQPFYERFRMRPAGAMVVRNYARQVGRTGNGGETAS